ncbi:hypothetical protein [uncultured Dysgonomonas sp.]|uniref:Uncharacterized protein n=1 Tax=uncultured Dysgonomonas sp. TaxID=206096 RepID=A0A212IVV0_9BACT|nr:hypothetical protein [uncultured Dysgonomonas sp.]SBV91333.1 conserved hypothetical protein [uncultured Dysgonomonas sp.]
MGGKFIKVYVLISLWFWAGMLLSEPLRKAFGDMHLRLAERIYDASFGQVEKLIKKIVDWFSLKYKKTALYMEDCTYELRVKVVRTLVKKELLEELNHKNLVSAIARAKLISRSGKGIPYEEFERLGQLAMGRAVDRDVKEAAIKTAFNLCDTDLFKQIIARIPRAQERILLAFEQAEGESPYDSVKNEEFRKFIRE